MSTMSSIRPGRNSWGLPWLAAVRSAAIRVVSLSSQWRRYSGPLGVVAILAGFAVIVQSWWDSGSTADIRVQMQDLISAVGGGVLVLSGVLMLVAEVIAASHRQQRRQTEAITAALDRLVELRDDRPAAAVAPTGMVVATHASYHRPDCDLLDGRESLRPLSAESAAAQGLTPCRTCLAGPAA